MDLTLGAGLRNVLSTVYSHYKMHYTLAFSMDYGKNNLSYQINRYLEFTVTHIDIKCIHLLPKIRTHYYKRIGNSFRHLFRDMHVTLGHKVESTQ